MTDYPVDHCRLLQEIGFPAVRVRTESGEFIECNESFNSLLAANSPKRDTKSFVTSVFSKLTSRNLDLPETLPIARVPAQFRVQFLSADQQMTNFEVRTIEASGTVRAAQSIIALFIPITGPVVEQICEEYLSQGEAAERLRIRNELHKGISQQLLGAAFGCKALATKISRLNGDLGKEATELAELVNSAVSELQALVRFDRDSPERR